MKRAAFLTAACMIEGAPGAREDAWEHTRQFAAIEPACADLGIRLEARTWDDPEFDPAGYDAVVVGTCWDYMARADAFLSALARFEAAGRLFNPLKVIEWNARKTYLKDLAARGVATIPTVWADRAGQAEIAGAFDALGADTIVIKPLIGASAWRQARLKRGEALPVADALPPAACLIQPYLRAAETDGETTLLFFDRRFSHALVKRPKAGDYRTQSMYGATEAAVEPDAAALAAARDALGAVEGDLLYARVDLMRGPDGRWLVMELELIEPYYYPDQGPQTGANFARALARLTGRAPSAG